MDLRAKNTCLGHKNQTMKQFDYLIIGQGIAGSVLAFQLQQKGKSVFIINQQQKYHSSTVAAGMYNPVSGKRMVLAWKWKDMLEKAKNWYGKLEIELKSKYLTEMPTYQCYASVKEQNDFSIKAEDSLFMEHLNANPEKVSGFKDELGAFEIVSTGWLQTQELLPQLRNKWKEEALYLEENFDYTQLVINESSFTYKEISASKIVFCEGYEISQNPYFSYIPMVLAKGDVFKLKCERIPQNRIWKKGLYLVPQGNSIFKAGSTYRWGKTSAEPDEEGKIELKEKLDALLNCEYEILEHLSGIRPASKDRYPVLGEHPNHKNMFVFNGLGTKGIMWAPYMAEKLLDLMEHEIEIENIISVKRFEKYLIP